MRRFECIQNDIQKCTDGFKLAVYLADLSQAAIQWNKKNAPDNIQVTESGDEELTMYGMAIYLDSVLE